MIQGYWNFDFKYQNMEEIADINHGKIKLVVASRFIIKHNMFIRRAVDVPLPPCGRSPLKRRVEFAYPCVFLSVKTILLVNYVKS